MTKVYLASPYGFSHSTAAFLDELRLQLRNAGLEVLDPWELGEHLVESFRLHSNRLSTRARITRLRKLNYQIGRINHEAIDKANVVVAGLDGPDVDSGTASEIGYAYGRGKLILGYRGDIRLTGENEAALVNIQVQYWIERSGGCVVTTLRELLIALKDAQKRKKNSKRDDKLESNANGIQRTGGRKF